MRLWFHKWRLCCPYLFFISLSPSFDAPRGLYLVIVTFPGYLYLYIFTLSITIFLRILAYIAKREKQFNCR